jgi:hypothetical protein
VLTASLEQATVSATQRQLSNGRMQEKLNELADEVNCAASAGNSSHPAV